MSSVLYLMPDLFDLYFYDQYILDWWWYGAVTQGQFRTDENDWYSRVEETDNWLHIDGTYEKIGQYLEEIMESEFDFEGIASQIDNQEDMELFTGVMYVLASQTYELDWYVELPKDGSYDDEAWLVIWRTLEMANIVHRPDAPGPYDDISGLNYGQIQSLGLKYSMNQILREINENGESVDVTAEWLTQFQCCYDG